MRSMLPFIHQRQAAGHDVALATVVHAWGSSPRPVGSQMAVCRSGAMEGSVSGGCVEGAVHETAQQVMADGRPQLVRYGVSNDDAWAVGLTCGGSITVYVEPLPLLDAAATVTATDDPLVRVLGQLEAEAPVLLATVVDGPGQGRRMALSTVEDGPLESVGSLGDDALDSQIRSDAVELTSEQRSAFKTFGEGDEATSVFLHSLPPRKRLIIVGAVHVAIPLVHFANQLGFRTIVVDPRTAFATPERFPHADSIVTDWPDEALEALQLNEGSFVCLLSHDMKLDVPALQVALNRPVRYLGALGSKKTHQKRLAALAEVGISEDDAAAIHNPIGLNLGGRRAEDIAVAIIAEMVAVDHGRSF